MSDRTGSKHIWRMNVDGSNPLQLTSNSGERWPRCSPDGEWVVYASIADPPGLFKVSIEGGTPVPLTNKTSTYPAISPDGNMIATGYFEDPGANKTAIYSFQGGEPLKILDFSSFYISWAPDGRSLTYIDGHSAANIVSQQMTGDSSTKELTHFKDGVVLAFDWSRDGKLAFSHKVITSDAVMLTDVK
jgi:WD40 repeat protein